MGGVTPYPHSATVGVSNTYTCQYEVKSMKYATRGIYSCGAKIGDVTEGMLSVYVNFRTIVLLYYCTIVLVYYIVLLYYCTFI